MSEAVEGRVPAQQQKRARWPQRAGWPRRAVGPWGDTEPPSPGMWVDGYRLEVRLGEGGQGMVYRAQRGGRLYAIKFLSLASPDWAWRELEARLRLRRVRALAVEAHGQWPHEAPRYLYLVTPYVHGRPLYAWARWKNPTAREVARLVREVARQLVEVHRAGVVHRDVKCANVLVRSPGGQPVLVDFGVSTYAGAPEITHPLAMPGTRYYRSPEALRFRRERAGEHSPARASDDLWALGVVLYWLLTGNYPFETEVADEGALAEVILKHEPEPPHVCNPRVPRALSELCLRMQEKRPEARFRNAEALGEALEAVLAEADGAWDVALCEEWGPEDATTQQEEGLDVRDWLGKVRRLRLYARLHPRRGGPMPSAEASTLPSPPESSPSGGDGEAAGATSTPPPPRARAFPWHALAWGGAAWVLGLVGLFLLLRSPPSPAPGEPSLTPEVISAPTMLEVTKPGQEVASAGQPPEGGRGAAPSRAPTPAPEPTTMLRKDKSRSKTEEKPSAPSRSEAPRCVSVTKRVCVAGVCSWALAGCPGVTPQVRPTPPDEPCPPDAERTMVEKLDIGIGASSLVSLTGSAGRITVREGEASVPLYDDLGHLEFGTLLHGRFIIGEGRVYGRFTQARRPNGETYPVCIQIEDGGGPGTEVFSRGGPETAEIATGFNVSTVRRFASTSRESVIKK